jgi:hypothetical protein
MTQNRLCTPDNLKIKTCKHPSQEDYGVRRETKRPIKNLKETIVKNG